MDGSWLTKLTLDCPIQPSPYDLETANGANVMIVRTMADLSGRALRATKRDRALFVDRRRELQAARTSLEHQANVLVLGARGAGKSSFLHYLRSLLERDGAHRIAVVEGRVANSANEFLTLLRDALGAWQRVPLREVVPAVASSFGALASGELVLRPQAGETQTLLAELEALRRALPDERVTVLVDELPSAQVARTIFGRLRDELWELPLTWLVAADERDRAAYLEPPADAFFGRVIPLEPFDQKESLALLRRRLGDDGLADEELTQIVEEAGGNPRRLIALVHDVVTEGVDVERLSKRRAERERRLAELSEPARRLVEELEAGGPASPSDEGLLSRLGWKRSRASQVFAELERSGIVRSTSRPSAGTRPRKVYELVV